MSDDLDRFVVAQDPVWPRVLAELAAGAKRSHWIWFVFPQIQGLGQSAMSVRYALDGLDQARAYLAHPVLGPRLHTATEFLLRHPGRSPESILGSVDAMKLRSSMTLFREAAPTDPLFLRALTTFFKGELDQQTLSLLAPTVPSPNE